MADEQTPQSDLIDDAIRQAERQLEEKLEALRMSALGEPSPAASPAEDDVAVLRPTGGTARASGRAARTTEGDERDDEGSSSPARAWREAGGEDVSFTPDEDSVTLTGNELYVPDEEASFDERPHDVQPHDDPQAQADPVRSEHGDSVSGLTPVWETAADASSEPPTRPVTHAAEPAPVSSTEDEPEVSSFEPRAASDAADSSWTASGTGSGQPLSVTAVPGEDEMRFWAHTRTALRNLHQLTEGIPTQVSDDVANEVQRIVSQEIGPADAALRSVQQQLQQQLPRLQDRLEAAIEQAMATPNNGIRQIRDDLPTQLDRTARELRGALREEIDQSAAAVHGAIQQDVAQLEQSIATNVTRMAHGTTDSVGRVERDVDALGETVVRFERGMHNEFDRVESQLRSAIERVDQTVREQVAEPAETVRRLDEELPSRFGKVERTLLEQMQSTQRDLSAVLTSLVEANRASLDRIASVASTLDDDRARRTEDVEMIVDTFTTGWEGLAGAVKALFEQNEQNSRRIAGIEQRLSQIRDLEGAVEGTMNELREHVRDLQPAPVVVTVAHPEAEVRNSARGGWLPEGPARGAQPDR